LTASLGAAGNSVSVQAGVGGGSSFPYASNTYTGDESLAASALMSGSLAGEGGVVGGPYCQITICVVDQPEPGLHDPSFTAVASALAAQGHVGVNVDSRAAAVVFGGARARADALAYAQSSDIGTLASSSLLAGTPVTATYRSDVLVTVDNDSRGPGAAYQVATFYSQVTLTVGGQSFQHIWCVSFTGAGPCDSTMAPFEVSFVANVGDTFSISLETFAQSTAGVYSSVCCQFSWGNVTTGVQSINSTHSYLDVIGADAVFSAASGHDYSISAVPESGSAPLALTGTLVVFMASRRRWMDRARGI
jgi:hypothetical protein